MMSSPFPPDNMTCHEAGHKKKCKDLCMNCWKWIQIQGHNPNTGETENRWKCADAWLPILTIENSQQQRATSVELNKLRNHIAKTPPAIFMLNENKEKTILEQGLMSQL